MNKKIIFAAAAIGLLAAACSNDSEGRGDAPVGDRLEAPRKILVNVDEWPNLSVICDGKTAILTTRGSNRAVEVVYQSTFCGGSGDAGGPPR